MTADDILMIQVQAMSELEKASFIEKLVEHLSRNQQLHLIDDCYEVNPSELDELRDEIDELEHEKLDLEFDIMNLREQLEKALENKAAS